MISVQFIIGMLNAPVVQFIQFVISFQFAKISFLRLNEIHQLDDEHDHIGTNSVELPENKSLIINNVAFQYTPNSKLVLQGIRLIIPEGKVTAIVGDSGSGKSTLLKLLLRLYKPSYGEIMIGSMNINNISLRQWRDKCGAVMQDGKIFNDTIMNNIVLDDEKIDYEKVEKSPSYRQYCSGNRAIASRLPNHDGRAGPWIKWWAKTKGFNSPGIVQKP